MRIFLALLKINLKIMSNYRASFIVSLIGDPIVLIINIANFTAIYTYNNSINILGYSLSQIIWYFAGINLVWYCIWNAADNKIANKILSGDLSIDLLKPVSVFMLELSSAISTRILSLVLEFLPSIIIFSIFFFPNFLTVFSFVKFFITVIFAFILYFLINFLIGLSSFSIKSNYSLQSIKIVIISLTAGAFIPLDYFPSWFKTITGLLPFQYLFYWPIQILLNKQIVQSMESFLKIIAFQILWILFFIILSKFLWKLSIKKFCSAGG